MSWHVTIKSKVAKVLKNRQKISKDVESAVIALVAELKAKGPAVLWPHYGKLSNQGKNVDRKSKKIEVYYVGTHEKAPY